MNIVNKILKTEENKRLLSNILSLSMLQAVNYILPLITLPYLLRVLGVELFGLLAFAGATVAFFNIVTEYGFNLTATRDVSIYRDNRHKLVEIFSAVMVIKISLMLVSLFVFSLIVFSFEKFSKDILVYFLTFSTILGQILFPVWLFQGLESMKQITYLNIFAKSVFTVAVFVFVQEQSDFYIVPMLTSMGLILSGVWSLYIVKTKYSIGFKWQPWCIIKQYLDDGWHIFISNIAVSLYTISTTIILGMLTNNTMVGYFSAADKIIQAFKGLISPISQAIYPYISNRIEKSKKEGMLFIRKITSYISLFTALVSIFIFVFADLLANVILGDAYKESIILLRIMSLLPFLIGLSNMFGVQTMVNFNRKKAFSNILIAGSFFNLILSLILVPKYQYIGSAISVLCVEIFITITMFCYLQCNGLKIIGKNKYV
jgi:PST family polysaccharide transporter